MICVMADVSWLEISYVYPAYNAWDYFPLSQYNASNSDALAYFWAIICQIMVHIM